MFKFQGEEKQENLNKMKVRFNEVNEENALKVHNDLQEFDG